MPTSHRIRRAVSWVSLGLVGVLALGWMFFYLDSLHERRRAEHLIAELKSFPFSTAGFPELRDLASRYGGSPVLQFPVVHFPPPDLPQISPPKVPHPGGLQVQEVKVPVSGPICNIRDCTFEIGIAPRLFKLLSFDTPVWVWSSLAYSGIRPWNLYLRLELRNGRLETSQTLIRQIRHAKFHGDECFLPLDYSVKTTAMPLDFYNVSPTYDVYVPHITGGPGEVLRAQIMHVPNAPVGRAFDIELHCVTAIFAGCKGFDELAPSAWADYRAIQARFKEERHLK
jgi:hypothetical protein